MNEFSSIPNALTSMFIITFWLIVLILCLSLKGKNGRHIQLLNIFQLVLGLVSGITWLSISFLVGFPLIFVTIGFFIGIIQSDR